MAKTETEKSKRLSREERRKAFQAAAGELFFTHGFAKTSLDNVVMLAGGSKRNLYEEFGGKEELLCALIEDYAELMLSSLDEQEEEVLANQLIAFGKSLLETILSPFMLGVSQSVITASISSPAIAEMYFSFGPQKAQNYVEQLLERARRQGEAQIEDCALAADIFIGMLRNNSHLQTLIKLRDIPTEGEIDRQVRVAVQIFMRGIAPR